MKELFINCKLAEKLIAKGFKEQCIAYWETEKTLNFVNTEYGSIMPTEKNGLGIDAPMYQQVMDWFRKEHELCFSVLRDGGYWFVRVYDFSDEENSSPMDDRVVNEIEYEYHQALDKAIKSALKLI